jgi:hypothetical protein
MIEQQGIQKGNKRYDYLRDRAHESDIYPYEKGLLEQLLKLQGR